MSVADLATKVLNKVAANATIGEAVQAVSISRSSGGTYNPATDSYEGGGDSTITGRAVFETDPAKADLFPDATGGPGEYRVYLFEMTAMPIESEAVTIGGNGFVIVNTPRKVMNLGTAMIAATVRET